ncbi:MAG: ABC transporter ATP-binding protein [Lachnospiraceae bacterium]|nr:ABC transporter ATP-binding protein [Lachnospiraceae bacterium]
MKRLIINQCIKYRAAIINKWGREIYIVKEIKKYICNLNRMFRCLFNMVPRLFILAVAIAVFEAVLPYVNVIAVQLIIDGLMEQRTAATIVNIIIITIAVHVLFRMILGEFRKKREISEMELGLKFQKYLSTHEMRLSFADIESTRVQELKRNIEQARMRNGGVEKVVYDFEIAVKNIASLLTAGIVFARIFVGQHRENKMSFWTSLFPIVILIMVVIVCTVITLNLQSKQNILIAELNDKANQANGSAFSYMQFISNYHFGKEIRIFDLGDYLCDFFDKLWTSSTGYTIIQKLGREKAKIPCITVLCNEILNIFIYILAIGKAYAKEITVGNVVVYISSIQAFLQSVVLLIGASGEIIGTGIFLQPFLDLIDIEEEILVSDTREKMPSGFHELSFEHVCFKYPGQEYWVLEDVNFTLKVNQKMALVGENGAGKSTLIKLICRFYEPNQGCIKINGVDVRRYDKKQYWDMISAVFQDFSLPALTLGNIISGKDDFDKEKEMDIFRKVGMEKWMEKLNISFDQYLYNDFSDSGVEISGGESQKLAIARAVYKEAPFIILDEPTSALDPISEAAVFDDFHQICKEKTCIFISHRLYSCKLCDFILVLHKGKVVQQGTHEELLSYAGEYKELWNSQAGLYREGNMLHRWMF